MKKLLIFAVLILSATIAYSQTTTLEGYWNGHINIQGQQLIIKTHFEQDSGTIDIPRQMGKDIPLQKISVSQDSVSFEFMASPGLAQFKGKFKTDSTIAGNFYQRGMQFPFKLEIGKEKRRSAKESPPVSKPYNHKDLIIKNDSIKIGGTLTWPKNNATNKLVIMMSGSGAQDREESLQPLSNFKPFAVLADSLTMHTIATFRYDDRGVGQSSGNFTDATLQMLASDVEAVINRLTAMPDHNFEQVILLGHSQGGIVGGRVAANNTKVDKLILMASPSVTLNNILQYQLRQNFKQNGFEESKIDPALSAFQEALEAVHQNNNVEEAKKSYQKKFGEMFRSLSGQNKSQIANLDSTASTQGNSLLQSFTTPQMQSLLFYNPTKDLRKLSIPVLALFGGKDVQVKVEVNKPPIKNVLETADVPYRIKVFSQANHLFQKADTGLPQEYGTLKSVFLRGFTSTVTEWINKDGYHK